MKTAFPVWIAACAFAVTGAAQAAPPHDHDHAGHAAHSHASAGADAQRWETDAPLRKGMGEVRAALADLRHLEMGHMPPAMAGERAAVVVSAVEGMFAECKLPPDADAALHAILIPLLEAAKRLGRDHSDVGAVAAMREAVADYPQRFDDPQWTAADESAHAH